MYGAGTNTPMHGQCLQPTVQPIALSMLIFRLQRDGLGGFCNHMMCLVVNYANECPLTVELVGSKLSERGQCRIGGMSSGSKRIIAGWKRIESTITRRSDRGTAIEGVIDGELGCTIVPVTKSFV